MSVAAISSCPRQDTPTSLIPEQLAGRISARVLEVLVSVRNERGDMTLSLSRIAAALDSTPRQVRRSLHELHAAGVIHTARAAQAAGRHSPAVYRLSADTKPPTSTCVLSRDVARSVTTAVRPVIHR